MKEFLAEHLPTLISLILAPLATWFFITKPYQKKDLKSKDIENDGSQSSVIAQNLELYQRMLDDVEARYEEKLKKRDLEIEILELEVEKLKKRLNLMDNK